MATQAKRSFADSIFARLIAFGIAVLILIVLVLNYREDFKQLFSGTPEAGLPTTNTETTPEEAANPALASCLQKRIGDVDRMKDEGILSEAQYTQFRARAKELCIQLHSG